MNQNERRIVEGLKALAAAEERLPSAAMKGMLLRELRPRRNYFKAALGLAAIAAAVCVALAIQPRPKPRVVSAVVLPSPPVAPAPVALPAPKAVTRTRRRRQAVAAARIQPAPLMQIPYTDAITATERTGLVRVSMPATQLLSWGFPFSGNDPNIRVKADVLVGEDGLARAVRLVK